MQHLGLCFVFFIFIVVFERNKTMTDKITTTLAKIRSKSPCEDGYKKLVKSLGGVRKYGAYTPVTFRQIYESNGHADTLWCLQTVDEKYHPLLRHFAIDCAEDVKHLMTDKRSLNALKVARLYADCKATDAELCAASDAARAASDAAWAARAAAWAARDAAWAASGTASDAWAARAAAWAAAWAASGTASDAARAASGTASDAWAAWAASGTAWAARDARHKLDAQMERLFTYCETGERVKYKQIKVTK